MRLFQFRMRCSKLRMSPRELKIEEEISNEKEREGSVISGNPTGNEGGGPTLQDATTEKLIEHKQYESATCDQKRETSVLEYIYGLQDENEVEAENHIILSYDEADGKNTTRLQKEGENMPAPGDFSRQPCPEQDAVEECEQRKFCNLQGASIREKKLKWCALVWESRTVPTLEGTEI
jgi:hypothetical protein